MGNYIPFALGLNQSDSNGVENLDGNNANSYRYPPKSGLCISVCFHVISRYIVIYCLNIFLYFIQSSIRSSRSYLSHLYLSDEPKFSWNFYNRRKILSCEIFVKREESLVLFPLHLFIPLRELGSTSVRKSESFKRSNFILFTSHSGAYFANHFVMAGERFDNINSETFLFGENNDLNYLSSKPVPVSMCCLSYTRDNEKRLIFFRAICGNMLRLHYV